MNWMVIAKNLEYLNNTKLIGIYKTRKAANFIINKVKESKRGRWQYIVQKTTHSLSPETSYKVDDYLDNLETPKQVV